MSNSSKLSSRFADEEVYEEVPESREEVSPAVEDDIPDVILKDKLLEKVEGIPIWFDYSEQKQKELISSFVENNAKDFPDKSELVEKLFKTVSGFGLIQNLIENDDVQKIYLNGTITIYVQKGSEVVTSGIKPNEKEFVFIKNALSQKSKGFSVNVIDENCIVIEKIKHYNIETLINENFITSEQFDFLVKTVKDGKNIVISGGISSGKTKLTDCLVNCADERCVLIEDKSQIESDFDGLVKLSADRNGLEDTITSAVRLSPKFIFADLNLPCFCERKGVLFTLRSYSLENTINRLCGYYCEKYSLKSARAEILDIIDYVVFIKDNRVTIAQLSPAKTSTAQVKILSDYQ